jgi:hypothetical protein
MWPSGVTKQIRYSVIARSHNRTGTPAHSTGAPQRMTCLQNSGLPSGEGVGTCLTFPTGAGSNTGALGSPASITSRRVGLSVSMPTQSTGRTIVPRHSKRRRVHAHVILRSVLATALCRPQRCCAFLHRLPQRKPSKSQWAVVVNYLEARYCADRYAQKPTRLTCGDCNVLHEGRKE